jgi:methanogen homocitrate synthase
MKFMVRMVKKLTNNLPVEVHTHNDFGMAVATELAGVEAGADCVHSCANGLGERTGNAALEELIVRSTSCTATTPSTNWPSFRLGELVSRISRFPIAANKPDPGRRNFTANPASASICGERAAGDVRDASGAYRALRRSVLGKKSGKLSITYNLEKLGITDADDEAIGEMLKRVKDKGIEKRGLLTDEEFREIVDSVLVAKRLGWRSHHYFRQRSGSRKHTAWFDCLAQPWREVHVLSCWARRSARPPASIWHAARAAKGTGSATTPGRTGRLGD